MKRSAGSRPGRRKNDALEAFECKWKQENAKAPAAFGRAYPDAPFTTIHQKNYLDFIG